mgnify:CR=1 FL=1
MYLNMDGKGRLQMPAKLRKRLGLGRRVKAEEKGKNLIIHTGREENFWNKYAGFFKGKGKLGQSDDVGKLAEEQFWKESKDKFR